MGYGFHEQQSMPYNSISLKRIGVAAGYFKNEN